MSSSAKKAVKNNAQKVKFKRGVLSSVIEKLPSVHFNRIHTVGATQGVMVLYVTKPHNEYKPFMFPINQYLKGHEDVMKEYQIGAINRRRKSEGDDQAMPCKPDSQYPYYCCVRVVTDASQNTIQARKLWAKKICKLFNDLGSDEDKF